jgi:hypothetical protein
MKRGRGNGGEGGWAKECHGQDWTAWTAWDREKFMGQDRLDTCVNFPKREELLLRRVRALPKASSTMFASRIWC